MSERKGKGLSTFIMLLFVLSAFSPLLISVSASDTLPYTEADPGTGINPCSDDAQAIVDNATIWNIYTPLDRDEDSICNCFEYYGFRYDAVFYGTYVRAFELNETGYPVLPVPQDPKDPYFLTDPTQFSTDQDPYGDGMEASGVNMDTAVLPPGNHPLVPAYPDIYARMNSYEITPVGPITTTTGKTTQDAWSESTTKSDETSSKWGISAGASVEAGVGFPTSGYKVQVTCTYSHGNSHTTSHSTTTDNSGFNQQEWSQAETTDPSQAARIKLNLKFHNRGAAPTADVVPTASIILGGNTINTFTFDDTIGYLSANSFYPTLSDWSVEKDKDGNYIYLTLDELRAFETGAKITLDITQMDALVKKWDPGKNEWEFTQDWAPYEDSMDHVCACLMVDKGDGNMSDYLVYAASTEGYGPVVTLRDAVLWVVGGENDPKTGEVYINIRKPDGTVIRTPVKDWRFGFDPDTFNQIEPGSYVLNVTMKPGMVVVAKAPPCTDLEYPQIKWVYGDVKGKVIKAYVTDYYEVSYVVFKSTPDAKGQNMSTDGSNIYTFNLPSDYMLIGEEIVEATNDAGKSAYKHVRFGYVWGMFRHDPMHTGRSPYTGSDTATQKWRFQTGGDVDSSPAIGWGGTIYVGSFDHYLYAINLDGTQKWRFQTAGCVVSSPAIGADGTIYVGSDDHYLYAINLNGTQKWKFPTGDRVVWSSPAIGADGTIYVGSCDHYLYAINPNGTQKWRFHTGDYVDTSPAIGADGTIYVGSWDNYLYAINPEDGTQKWRFPTGNWVTTSPAIGADGTIYVGSCDHYLYAINPDGTQKWRFHTGNEVASSPAIGAGGTIYVGSLDHYLYAINPEDGTQKWRFQTGDGVNSSPAIGADGTIYVGSYDTYLYAINPEDGTQKWRFHTGDGVDSSPAIGDDGTIYVGSLDHYLYAIGK